MLKYVEKKHVRKDTGRSKKARRSYDVGVRLKKLIDYGGYIL